MTIDELMMRLELRIDRVLDDNLRLNISGILADADEIDDIDAAIDFVVEADEQWRAIERPRLLRQMRHDLIEAAIELRKPPS